MWLIDDPSHRVGYGKACIEKVDLRAREHHFPQFALARLEDVIDEIALVLAQFLVPSDEITQLFSADRFLSCRGIDAENANDHVGGERQSDDERAEQSRDEVDRSRREEGDLLHTLQGDALGHQLPENKGEVGDENGDDNERQGLSDTLG